MDENIVQALLEKLIAKVETLQDQIDVLVEGQDVITEKLNEIGLPVGDGFSQFES